SFSRDWSSDVCSSDLSIRLYGNGGHMLSEANNGQWKDDLEEVAILVLDGGDGIFNNNDRIVFYAPGPHQWIKDSANLRFTHRKRSEERRVGKESRAG